MNCADPHQAQEQADAALARQIMAEEDAAARSYQQRAHNQYNAQPASDDRFAQLNYTPRQRPPRTGAPSAAYQEHRDDDAAPYDQSTQPMGAGLSAGAREDIDQAMQTVKNAAAEGKRMAIGLFGQLKAKVGELQNPKPAEETCVRPAQRDSSHGQARRRHVGRSAGAVAAAAAVFEQYARRQYDDDATLRAGPPARFALSPASTGRRVATAVAARVSALARARSRQRQGERQRRGGSRHAAYSDAAACHPCAVRRLAGADLAAGVPSGGQPRQRISLLGPQGSSGSIKPAVRRQDSDNDSRASVAPAHR